MIPKCTLPVSNVMIWSGDQCDALVQEWGGDDIDTALQNCGMEIINLRARLAEAEALLREAPMYDMHGMRQQEWRRMRDTFLEKS